MKQYAAAKFFDEQFVRCFMKENGVNVNDGNAVMTLLYNDKIKDYDIKWTHDCIDNADVVAMIDAAKKNLKEIS